MSDNTQEIDGIPDELDMFIATHTSVSGDTDDGVYREAEYRALKKALGSLVKKHELQAKISALTETSHQGHVNLRTAGAVAEWADIRITDLRKELQSYDQSS